MDNEGRKLSIDAKRVTMIKALGNLEESAADYEHVLIKELPIRDHYRNRDLLIKRFELAYECMWKALKAVLRNDGEMEKTAGAAGCFRFAQELGIIKDSDLYITIIRDRNIAVHAYDDADCEVLAKKILKTHLPLMRELCAKIMLLPPQ